MITPSQISQKRKIFYQYYNIEHLLLLSFTFESFHTVFLWINNSIKIFIENKKSPFFNKSKTDASSIVISHQLTLFICGIVINFLKIINNPGDLNDFV